VAFPKEGGDAGDSTKRRTRADDYIRLFNRVSDRSYEKKVTTPLPAKVR
jgi:hypothetical protein